ncbi:MAG TPA: oligosaccharide flippase family protein [Novosphingobium sp.]|nr:oligosaccharide flippase family protein [Novosphingobium sp.]
MPANAALREPSSGTVLLRATMAAALSRALGFPLTLLISAWLARSLSRPEFAFMGVLTTFSVLFGTLAQMGYQSGVVRQLGEAQSGGSGESQNAIYFAAVLTTLAAGVVLGIGFLLFGTGWLPTLRGATDTLFLLAAALLVARSLNTVTGEAFRGIGMVGTASNFSGMGTQGGIVRCLLMLAALGVVAIGWHVTLEAALAVSIFASVASSLAAAAIIRGRLDGELSFGRILGSARSRFDSNFVRMMSESLQYWTSSSAALLIGGNILAAEKVADVVAALQILNLIASPLTLLLGAAPAVLIKLRQEGRNAELEGLMRGSASAALLMSLGACGVLMVIGPKGFQLIFGPSYSDAYFHYLLLMIGIIFNVLGGMAGKALLMIGDVRDHRRAMGIALAISLPIFYFGALIFGPYGLSAAISVSVIVQNVLLVSAARRKLGLKTYAYLRPAYYIRHATNLPALFKTMRTR